MSFQLWPLFGGKLVKPHRTKLFYVLLNEANVKITLNNFLCPFSCGLSLEVNSSNRTGASFSTFHR